MSRELSVIIEKTLDKIQGYLNFEYTAEKQYETKYGLGRTGFLGTILGIVVGLHAGILFTLMLSAEPLSEFGKVWFVWCEYVVCLAVFHLLEFLITSIAQPSTLSSDSFLVNHSTSYTAAALVSWTEFWLQAIFFRRYKLWMLVHYLGLLMTVGGQIVRSVAMLQCRENFSHTIATAKNAQHELVTTGIYTKLRHPAYFGWFYWSIGTQCILCNPLCIIAYAYSSWSFFKERIPYEEKMLHSFFGAKYREYAEKTPIGIPFIQSQVYD